MSVLALENTFSCSVEWDTGGHHANPLPFVVPFSLSSPSASKPLTSTTTACHTQPSQMLSYEDASFPGL